MMLDKMLIIIIFIVLFRFVSSEVDYCGLCENGTHTMCKYQGPAENCPGYKKKVLSPVEKKYIVDIHNDIRNHVASGMETRGALGSQPPAADMTMLQWDDELGEIAQRWADQCIKVNNTHQHDLCKRTERFEVGQNILTAITNEPDLPELSVLIFNWYQQVTNMVPSDIDIFLGVKKGKYLIGQYTQLVWSETRFVGCGIITFTESDYEVGTYQHRLVCNYGPAGNVIGEAVYQRGPACSKCPTRRCDTVRTSLCQGTDSKNPTIKFNPSKSKDHHHITLFNSNYSDTIAKKMYNAICLNPDEGRVTKCVTKISETNVTSSHTAFDTKNRLKHITFAALPSDNIGLHKSDQATLKNLIALWKKLKLKNITDTFFMLNNWTENAIGLDDKSNALLAASTSLTGNSDLKDADLLPKLMLLANLTKYPTKSDVEPYRSELNESLEGFLKNTSYISTVIPSTVVTSSVLENIINQNITVFDSSQVVENPLIIDDNFDIYSFTRNLREKKLDLHYLENGVVLGDGGEKHHRHLKDAKHKALQSFFKLNQDFTDIGDLELPSNGQFRRERGKWHDGHCRCENMEFSSENAASKKRTSILLSVTLLLVPSNIITIFSL